MMNWCVTWRSGHTEGRVWHEIGDVCINGKEVTRTVFLFT
jgi:hypothetical protein